MKEHTQEPWESEGGPMIIHGKPWSLLSAEDYDRARQCVNACAGIEDPEKMITVAKEAIRYIAGGPSITRLKNAIKALNTRP